MWQTTYESVHVVFDRANHDITDHAFENAWDECSDWDDARDGEDTRIQVVKRKQFGKKREF